MLMFDENTPIELKARIAAAAFGIQNPHFKEVNDKPYEGAGKFPPLPGQQYFRVTGKTKNATLQMNVHTLALYVDFHHYDKPKEGQWTFRFWKDDPQLWKPYMGFSNQTDWKSLHLQDIVVAAFRFGYDASSFSEFGALSGHEQIETRFDFPKEYWPDSWQDATP
jgi:hypothetical protein